MSRGTVWEIVKDRPVYFVSEDDSVLSAVSYMTERQVGAVPVLTRESQEGTLADQMGIFSERDVMTRVVAAGLDPASTPVSEVMTKKVAVLSRDCTHGEALAIMQRLHIRHLPVVEGQEILGCVSIRELHVAELEAKEARVESLDDYIERMEDASWRWMKEGNG